MTGTKQLLGHFYRLLDLLWQMLNRGRPTPTNSNGKKPLPRSIAGSQAFVFERIRLRTHPSQANRNRVFWKNSVSGFKVQSP
jgi:hypothetical protein